MRNSQRQDVRLTLAVILYLAAGACRSGDEVSPAFVSESQRAQQATVPAGTEARVSAVQVSQASVSQTWVVPVPGQRTRYFDEVVRRLEPEYRCREPIAGQITCVKQLPGDHLELTMIPSSNTQKTLSVRVRLEARPD